MTPKGHFDKNEEEKHHNPRNSDSLIWVLTKSMSRFAFRRVHKQF
jgi:hypothetical protein